MSTRILTIYAFLALCSIAAAEQVTSTFTYQGRLNQTGTPANGSFDLKFQLYNAVTGGAAVGAPVELPAQTLTNGLFSADLNFGGTALFDGTAYWIATSARPAGSPNYTAVAPREAVRPVPYASHALSAATVKDGGVTSGSLASGAVTASKLAPGAVGRAQLSATGTPGAGQVLGYDGAGLSWITPSGGGGSGPWLLSGSTAFYNGGKVGIGTSTPGAGILTVRTPVSDYGFEHTDGTARMSTYVGGSSVYGGWLGTVSNHPLNFFVNDGISSMTIATSGFVGIGTSTPATVVDMVGSQPVITMRDTSFGGKRSALQAVNGELNLFTDNYLNGSDPFGYVHLHNSNGCLGIGSASPVAKLEVVAQDALRLIGFQPFLSLVDSNANWIMGRIQGVDGKLVFHTAQGGGFYTSAVMDNTGMHVSGTMTSNVVSATTVNAGNIVSGNTSVSTLTVRGGADLAEPFAMSEHGIEPGSVVVIDEANPGKLRQSTCAYDKKVAGIVSGANGIKPGISMIQEDKLEAGENVALSGRVFVKADTSAGTIEPGDLLTTSGKPGSAMKAADQARSQGAILGKAMTGLSSGAGMVLVLVTLQ